MQIEDLQSLIAKLKENGDLQVETTTIGKLAGDRVAELEMALGKDVLARQVVTSSNESMMQVLDISSGQMIVIKSGDDVIEKLKRAYSQERAERPTVVSSFENPDDHYKAAVEKEIDSASIPKHLYHFREVMYKSGCLEDRVALVERTIRVLEEHKKNGGDLKKIDRAQAKLNNLMTHVKSKRLAPGQIPSVYEIAIWEWVN